MRIDILTLFPSIFHNLLNTSILKIAQQKNLVDIRVSNIRNFTYDKHRTTDDCPYGGGDGMLLKPEPVFRAVESIWSPPEITPQLILLSPQGETFTQKTALELKEQAHLIMICGHYEGFDERIRLGLCPREISIGDYVLTGGEIPSMVILDAVIRLIPGVLGGENSTVDESFNEGTLEYPQYTRPPIWRSMEVPDVLRSGNHKKIEEWQKQESLHRTKERRPDLIDKLV